LSNGAKKLIFEFLSLAMYDLLFYYTGDIASTAVFYR